MKQEKAIIMTKKVPVSSESIENSQSKETKSERNEEKENMQEQNESFAVPSTSPTSDEVSECEINTFFF